MIWTLEKLLIIIYVTHSFIAYGKYVLGTFLYWFMVYSILVSCASLFMLCFVVDCIADEVRLYFSLKCKVIKLVLFEPIVSSD